MNTKICIYNGKKVLLTIVNVNCTIIKDIINHMKYLIDTQLNDKGQHIIKTMPNQQLCVSYRVDDSEIPSNIPGCRPMIYDVQSGFPHGTSKLIGSDFVAINGIVQEQTI